LKHHACRTWWRGVSRFFIFVDIKIKKSYTICAFNMAFTPENRRTLSLALRITTDFGASIAIPVVALAFLGKKLDERFGTSPWLLSAGFIVAACLSAYIVYRKAKEYATEYKKISTH
jgi:F0F1-type ATP synthase assembly protein I